MGMHDVILLDGCLGIELEKRKNAGQHCAYDHALFSNAALMGTPDAVLNIHRDYIRAGCQVITTSSFAITHSYLDKIGEGRRMNELAQLSIRLARKAVKNEGAEGKVLVAASVPPLGELYKSSTHIFSEGDMRKQYLEVVTNLNGADIYLCETMPSPAEAAFSAKIIRELYKDARIWVSFTPKRSINGQACLINGSRICDAVGVAITVGAETLLFNCASPEIIESAINEALVVMKERGISSSELRIGGYAHHWQEVDNQGLMISKQGIPGRAGFTTRKDLGPAEMATHASKWINMGASVIGGCCGIGPECMMEVGRCNGIGNASLVKVNQSQNVWALYWDKYLEQLDKNPYMTRALTAGVLGACSESVVRVVKKEKLLANRAPYIRQFLLGLLWRGPLLTTWLRILSYIFRNWNQKQLKTVVAKVFVHETVWDSFFVASYMYLLGILDKRPSSEVAEMVKKQFWPALIAQYKVWPFVQILNFWVIPFKLQVGFNNVVGVFMNALVTYRASKK